MDSICLMKNALITFKSWKESIHCIVSFYLGIVHEELLGQDVPAGVGVKVGVFVQQPGDDVDMDCRVEVLQLLKT